MARWAVLNASYLGDRYEDDMVRVYDALDAASAAEMWAEAHFDDYDYPEDMTCCVRPESGGEWSRFTVAIEARPHFRATREVEGAPHG